MRHTAMHELWICTAAVWVFDLFDIAWYVYTIDTVFLLSFQHVPMLLTPLP